MNWTFLFTRADGQTLTLGPPPCRILSVSGTDNGSFDFSTAENAGIDGVILTGRKIPPRQIEITGDLDYRQGDRLREQLIRFFSPALSGKAVANRNGLQRKIGYEAQSLLFDQGTLYSPQTYTLRLYCPSPCWEDMSDYGKNLAAAVPLIGFPLILPAGAEAHGRGSRRFLTGYTTTNRKAFLENNGEAPAGIRAVVSATRGQVVNPSVTLTDTGERIKVNLTMAKGDRLEISTVARKKTVTWNGENVFHMTDRSSVFFSIPIGGGTVEYDAEDGYTNLDLRLYYTPAYLGV